MVVGDPDVTEKVPVALVAGTTVPVNRWPFAQSAMSALRFNPDKHQPLFVRPKEQLARPFENVSSVQVEFVRSIR
jgi:hypothetical protein